MKTIRATLLLGALSFLMAVAPGHSDSVPGTKLNCHGHNELCQRSIDAIGCCNSDTYTCEALAVLNSDGNYNGRCVPTGRMDLINTYPNACHPKFEPCLPGQTPPDMCCNKDNNGNTRPCPPAVQGFTYSQCPEFS